MTDVIMAMQEPYMTMIINKENSHEFRKYQLKPSVQRIWFYLTLPHQSIKYVCEKGPAGTRNEGGRPLPKSPGTSGNREYNTFHTDWNRYDYAYDILAIYELNDPISLDQSKTRYGLMAALQGWMYTPASLMAATDLSQRHILM